MNNENKWDIKRKDQMFEKVVDCLNLYGHVLELVNIFFDI